MKGMRLTFIPKLEVPRTFSEHLFFPLFWPPCTTYRILVPWPRIETVTPWSGSAESYLMHHQESLSRSICHWTCWKVPALPRSIKGYYYKETQGYLWVMFWTRQRGSMNLAPAGDSWSTKRQQPKQSWTNRLSSLTVPDCLQLLNRHVKPHPSRPKGVGLVKRLPRRQGSGRPSHATTRDALARNTQEGWRFKPHRSWG